MRNSVGEEIKEIRKEYKLTQKQLAKMAGISEITLRKYEAESVPLKSDTLIKIAKALELPESYFLSFDTKETYRFYETFSKMKDPREAERFLGLPEGSILELSDSRDKYSECNPYTNEKRLLVSEKILLDRYRKLNPIGKQEAHKRIDELTQIPKYTNSDKEVGD